MGSKKAWGAGIGAFLGSPIDLLATGVGATAGAAIGGNMDKKKNKGALSKTEDEIAAEQKSTETGGTDPFEGGALTEVNKKKKGTFMSSGNETFSQAKLGV